MMRSTPATAVPTPSATPRPSSDAPTTTLELKETHSAQVSLAEPPLMHLSPPVPLEVSEFSMAHVGPPGKEASAGGCLSQDNGIKCKQTWDVPPAAHIPKTKVGDGSHRRDSSQISRVTQLKELEHSEPRIQSVLPEAKEVSITNEVLSSPLVSKVQGIWGSCIKAFSTNPFRKDQAEGKAEDKVKTPRKNKEDHNNNIRVSITGERLCRPEEAQECVTGKTWWDFPKVQNPDISYLQNTLLRAGVGETFQEAKAYGFRKGEAGRENPPTTTRNSQIEKDKSVSVANKKCPADSIPVNTRNSEPHISNPGEFTGHISNLHNQESLSQQHVGERPAGNESHAVERIETRNTDKGGDTANKKVTLYGHEEKDQPCWVHRWLASYSAPQELPKTAVANMRLVPTCYSEQVASVHDGGVIEKNDGARRGNDDNWVHRWLSSYSEAK